MEEEKNKAIAELIAVLKAIHDKTIVSGIKRIQPCIKFLTTNNYLLNLMDIGDEFNISCWAQLPHFFNPDRKIFLSGDWYSFIGSPSSEELNIFKWIFPQYNIGPLYELWKDFDDKKNTDPIFQMVEKMPKKSLIRLNLEYLKFTSFLIVPIVYGNHFLGTVTLFFISPRSFYICTDNPSKEVLEKLVEKIRLFYTNIFYQLFLAYNIAIQNNLPISELGQSYR